jgi:hemoglobin-like flavoprotein
MTPDQIHLVQDSFRSVVPIRDAAARIFYDRLFTLDPALRPLFASSDMSRQGNKLMASLGFVVGGLHKPETILPDVRALARRHVGYGVQDSHYATVGQALIETLEIGLGAAFTPQVRDAWICAYALLASVMQQAGAESELQTV